MRIRTTFLTLILCIGTLSCIAQYILPQGITPIKEIECYASEPAIIPYSGELLFTQQCDDRTSIGVLKEGKSLRITSSTDILMQAVYDDVRKNVVATRLRDQKYELVKFLENTEPLLLLKRSIQSKDADFQTLANLMVFIGKASTDKYWRVYTYDFKYDNLNPFDEPEADCTRPRWSAKGEYISYSTLQNNREVIKLMHWYGKEITTIRDSLLQLTDASWSTSGNKLVYAAYDIDSTYLFQCQKDGTKRVKLLSSTLKLSQPIWAEDEPFVIFTVRKTNGEQHLFKLNPDEATVPISLSLQPQ